MPLVLRKEPHIQCGKKKEKKGVSASGVVNLALANKGEPMHVASLG